MLQKTLLTDAFGAMTLNTTTGLYEAEIDAPYMKSGTISIAAEGIEAGVKRMDAFLAWMQVNHRPFKLSLEREIQDYDLVLDDVWDSMLGADWVDAKEGFLGPYLKYDFVEFNRGAIHVWVDTSGLHTDHMVKVTIDDAMQIVCCAVM